MEPTHRPVLLTEAVDHLSGEPAASTSTGHSVAVAIRAKSWTATPGIESIAFDLDVAAIERGEELRR